MRRPHRHQVRGGEGVGRVPCACTKLCQLAWRAATACRAARPACTHIGAGWIGANGGRSGQEAALGSGEHRAWPTCTGCIHCVKTRHAWHAPPVRIDCGGGRAKQPKVLSRTGSAHRVDESQPLSGRRHTRRHASAICHADAGRPQVSPIRRWVRR
eukprot:365003-Chlamydomonas_euryale.AAC.7